ncbi:Uncharacterised protein [Mycobacteroides abscessus subsp. abscessus]|nr:Uncharacterised protein [Mycobacteroides abscessus subsp. abscessus]
MALTPARGFHDARSIPAAFVVSASQYWKSSARYDDGAIERLRASSSSERSTVGSVGNAGFTPPGPFDASRLTSGRFRTLSSRSLADACGVAATTPTNPSVTTTAASRDVPKNLRIVPLHVIPYLLASKKSLRREVNAVSFENANLLRSG